MIGGGGRKLTTGSSFLYFLLLFLAVLDLSGLGGDPDVMGLAEETRPVRSG